jgi:hypothetical protein
MVKDDGKVRGFQSWVLIFSSHIPIFRVITDIRSLYLQKDYIFSPQIPDIILLGILWEGKMGFLSGFNITQNRGYKLQRMEMGLEKKFT